MASFIFVAGIAIAVICGVPWAVYMSVKLGTFAFYRGRELFFETTEENKKDQTDGKKSA